MHTKSSSNRYFNRLVCKLSLFNPVSLGKACFAVRLTSFTIQCRHKMNYNLVFNDYKVRRNGATYVIGHFRFRYFMISRYMKGKY